MFHDDGSEQSSRPSILRQRSRCDLLLRRSLSGVTSYGSLVLSLVLSRFTVDSAIVVCRTRLVALPAPLLSFRETSAP